MKDTSRFCKAYLYEQINEYPGFPLSAKRHADETVVYLHENLVVTTGIYCDEDVVFDDVTVEWESFCSEVLEFGAPDYVTAAHPRNG